MPTDSATSKVLPSPIPALGTKPELDSSQSPVQKGKYWVDKAPQAVGDEEHVRKSICPDARLRLHLEDLTHSATARCLNVVPLSTLVDEAIRNVQQYLFTPPGSSPDTPSHAVAPPQKPIRRKLWPSQEVRSVTLLLRSMDGVAYTTGTDLDSAHKEIHVNLGYLDAKKDSSNSDFLHEVKGVVTHEMVHVFQHNAHGTCPGGLIEGIADYVRTNSGLGAKHWKKWPANEETRGKKWDEGYQRTAWFLEWVEGSTFPGVIGELNYQLSKHKWDDGNVFERVTGSTLGKWWDLYKQNWESMNDKREKAERVSTCEESRPA